MNFNVLFFANAYMELPILYASTLVEPQVIASLSLGAEREFIMSPKVTTSSKSNTKRWDLANGSLVVMQGDTQENWRVSRRHFQPLSVIDNNRSMRFRSSVRSLRGAYP